jgi:hypothetical protein
MKAKSIKGKTPSEIQKALDESKREDFKPTLAIIMISNMEDAEPIRQFLEKKTLQFSESHHPKNFPKTELQKMISW